MNFWNHNTIIYYIFTLTVFFYSGQKAFTMDMEVYRNGLNSNWKHYGWAPHDYEDGGDAKVNFANWGGWIIAYPRSRLKGSFLSFRFKTDQDGDFLNISLGSSQGDEFEEVKITKKYKSMRDGWVHVFIPMNILNPDNLAFDRLKFRANRKLGRTWVRFNDIYIKDIGKAEEKKVLASETQILKESLMCNSSNKPISPYIFGIAYSPRKAYQDKFVYELNPSIRRWGGNPSSRYNWKLGNAWNTADDWYYRNVNYTSNPNYSWKEFLEENKNIGSVAAITIPLLGWVAKDTSSYSFPVSIYGQQQRTAPENSDIGNGLDRSGKKIKNNSPERTSIKVGPDFWKEWIGSIKKLESQKKLVDTYFLGNEPMLWNSTHRDVHPKPTTYDEIYLKTIEYSKMIRKSDPDALIAGPTLWGWTAYQYSSADGEFGYWKRPDRKKHGDIPFLEWYLAELYKYQKKTGHKSLDILDLHFYPEAKNVYGDRDSKRIAARRLRAVRSLWDKNHIDESWINEAIYLLPRMQELIANNYPGLKVTIGEYNFGGESYMSGALALAEILGIFASFDVYSAFYWTYPKHKSPAFNAFKAYRNYDNKKSKFLDYLMGYKIEEEYSYFVSKNKSQNKIVMVFINKTRAKNFQSTINFENCSSVKSTRRFELSGKGEFLLKLPENSKLVFKPWSLSVIEWNL